MGRVIVTEHVTLDGVMQAPGRMEEDVRGGFDRGGWAVPRADDEVTATVMGEAMAQSGALVLGRRTYEDFAASGRHGRTTHLLTCSTERASTLPPGR